VVFGSADTRSSPNEESSSCPGRLEGMRFPYVFRRNARLAVGQRVGRSSGRVHHARRPREPHEGIFRSSEWNPAFSGESAEAHPGISEVGFGLVPGQTVRGGVGKSARAAHAGAAWSEDEGKTLERRRKLRRGSAVCIGCNSPAAVRIRCRSKALEATKARDVSP
jgi:hypothetical protein